MMRARTLLAGFGLGGFGLGGSGFGRGRPGGGNGGRNGGGIACGSIGKLSPNVRDGQPSYRIPTQAIDSAGSWS